MNDAIGFNYIALETLNDWEQINDRLNDFQHGVVREILLKSRDYVRSDGTLHNEGLPDVHVLAQFQESPWAAILTIEGVEEWHYDRELDVSPGEASHIQISTLTPNEGPLWDLRFLDVHFVARRVSVRFLGEEALRSGVGLKQLLEQS
jgi:hypothetical protein